MEGAERSSHYFMNVKDIINMAFGELDGNMVNFRLIRIVLYLLARQLRLLERRIEVSIPISMMESSSSLSVTEVKVHAVTKKGMKSEPKTTSGKESRESKGITDSKESKGRRERRDVTGSREDKEGIESRKGQKEHRVGKESKDSRGSKERSEHSKSQDSKSSKDQKHSKDSKEHRGDKESREHKKGEKGHKDESTSSFLSKASRDDESFVSLTSKESKDYIGEKDSKKEHTSKDRHHGKGHHKGREHGEHKGGTSSGDDKGSGRSKSDKDYSESTEGRESKDGKKAKQGKEHKEGGKGQKEKHTKGKGKRADSYEQPDESPTPMASVDEMVESYTSSDTSRSGSRSPKMSVVTQEEFMKLAKLVDKLYARFHIDGSEDAQLMEDLYKSTSYTEAMAALQLSARLEATEKLLGRMINAIGTIAEVTPSIELDDETRVILEAHRSEKDKAEKSGRRGGKDRKASPKKGKGGKGKDARTKDNIDIVRSDESPRTKAAKATVAGQTEPEGLKEECVTYMDLEAELRKLSNEMLKQVTIITTRNVQTADRAFKIASGLESKLDSSLDVGPRMETLESQVATYSEQINALDTGLTSQMINYQEQLTQMQHELEVGLEAMAEALANAQGADTLAVAELNTNFTILQSEQDNMTWQQRDLQQSHDILATDLASLWKQIELLRETKSDRDEVTDALRDKAGIKDLNGLVSLEQFDAVRGDLEKRIASAYDKFNNQEIIWQKAIDDMLRELGEKADLIQLYGLRDEINKYLNAMRERVNFMAEIVGEPKAAIVTKKMFRDTACISCSSPATMDMVESQGPPGLPKFPDKTKIDAEKAEDKIQMKGDGDHKICYPGFPIPHPKHPKAHICNRFCGGSHTVIPSGPPKVPPSTIVTPLPREVSVEPGTDGKMYQVEKIPCIPCNVPTKSEGSPPPTTPVDNDAPAGYEANEGFARHSMSSFTPMPNAGTDTPPARDEKF